MPYRTYSPACDILSKILLKITSLVNRTHYRVNGVGPSSDLPLLRDDPAAADEKQQQEEDCSHECEVPTRFDQSSRRHVRDVSFSGV